MGLTVRGYRGDHRRMARRPKVAPEAVLTATLTLIAILAMAAAAAAEGPLHALPALSTGVSMDRLDAVRAINDRKAMTASLKRGARHSEIRDLALYTARRPREVAHALRTTYGPDNFLARGATAIATIVRITERSSQARLGATNPASPKAGKAELLGLSGPSAPRLRSRVTNKEIGVKLSSKW